MIKFTIITLFREALEPYLQTSMMWKAAEKGLAEFEFVNLRDFGLGPHKSVDDTPYGGGDGMLLRCEPVFDAIESVKAKDPAAKVILPTPVGEIWTQEKAREMSGIDLSRAASGRPVATGGRRSSSRCRAPEALRLEFFCFLSDFYAYSWERFAGEVGFLGFDKGYDTIFCGMDREVT